MRALRPLWTGLSPGSGSSVGCGAWLLFLCERPYGCTDAALFGCRIDHGDRPAAAEPAGCVLFAAVDLFALGFRSMKKPAPKYKTRTQLRQEKSSQTPARDDTGRW